MSTFIKNGHLVDVEADRDGLFDLLINDEGKVEKVGEKGSLDNFVKENIDIIDATGKYVLPGFIDLHVHFREPGGEYKETVRTGSMAAARGGYTTVVTMPNTKPVMDTVEHLNLQLEAIKKDAVINVLPSGTVTMGQEGKVLSDMEGMKKAGIVAISEDGKSVMNPEILRKGLMEAARLKLPFFDHCEDADLVNGGVMNAGNKAKELGMAGITNEVEDSIAKRDIEIAEEVGATIHLCHCSTRDTVKFVKAAKEKGLPVSAEVCPHHFTLTDEDIIEDDANFKMNPPLRSRADVEALKEGIRSGIMGMISTDHAPHSKEEKEKSIKNAPFGIVGLETAFALTVTELLGEYLDMKSLVERMSLSPAKLLKNGRGTLKEGAVADLVIADINEEYVIDSDKFLSKGKNTPFNGKKVRGKILYTLCNGKVVFKEEK
nr:dihydroorotase [uncultured Catonella sp.]